MWGPADVGPDAESERVFGDLILRIRRVPDEVSVFETHEKGYEPQVEEWVRWSASPDDRLELRPTLPDRPVVVSPEQPFYVAPRAEARVYVRLPLFASLYRMDEAGRETVITEAPSVVLSDTWWGSYTEGELAYWLETKARRSIPAEIHQPFLVVCPLLLINYWDEDLPVERFAIRTSYLSLFSRDGALWTDEIRVRYQGPHEASELSYTGSAPKESGPVERVAPPREPPPRGLRARTFGRLRAISGW